MQHSYFADKKSKRVLLGLKTKVQQAQPTTTKVEMVLTWKKNEIPG